MVTEADLDTLKRWSFTSALIGDTRVLISRTGVTGELGFELFVPADEAGALWERLMRAGADFGLKPYGVLAMFTLGLEKAYPAHGIDMDESRTPFHVGLDRMIKFDKGDFIGREALLRVREKGIDERWTGLVVDGSKPAAQNARVLAGDEDAGFVTYSDHGYSLGTDAGDSPSETAVLQSRNRTQHRDRRHADARHCGRDAILRSARDTVAGLEPRRSSPAASSVQRPPWATAAPASRR